MREFWGLRGGFEHFHDADHGRGFRARRGDVRLMVLDALQDGPKHGYDIIRYLHVRSRGTYNPSAGTIYPTLQLCEDEGLVRLTEEGERKVYHLTEAGLRALGEHGDRIHAFWSRFGMPNVSPATAAALTNLHYEGMLMMQALREAVDRAVSANDAASVDALREALAKFRESTIAVLTGVSPEPPVEPPAPPRPPSPPPDQPPPAPRHPHHHGR